MTEPHDSSSDRSGKKPSEIRIEGISVRDAFAHLSEAADQTSPTSELPDETCRSISDSGNAPRVFGNYELIEYIAEGGTGVVWKTRQRGMDRWLAIKILRAGKWLGENVVARFSSEAEAVSRLDHPNIAPIFETGEVDGVPFLTMRWFSGGSLTERLEQQPFSSESIAKMMVKLAQAIEHAHGQHILHRDLKPSNILLTKEGEPHVADFGLCRNDNIDSDLTTTGAILGSLAYLAPEMLGSGKDRHAPTVDVYGLGGILYQLLSGNPPFDGDNAAAIMQSVAHEDLVPPRQIRPTVNRDLETICLKCLAREPARRYPTAQALADDLERWINHHPIQARTASTGERVAKWMRRHPALTTAIGLTVLGLTTLAAVIHHRDTKLEKVQETARTTETALSDTASELAGLAWRKQLEQIDGQLEAGQQRNAIAQLIAMQRESPDSQLLATRIADALQRRNFGLPRHDSHTEPGIYYKSRVSPDGKWLVHLGSITGFRFQAVGGLPQPWQAVESRFVAARFDPANPAVMLLSDDWTIGHHAFPGSELNPHSAGLIQVDAVSELPPDPNVRPNVGLFRKHLIEDGRPPFSRGRLFAETSPPAENSIRPNRVHATWDESGNRILAWPFQTRSASVYDGETGQALYPNLAHPAPILTGAMKPGGGVVFLGDVNGQISRHEPGSNRDAIWSEQTGLPFISLAASADDSTIAAVALDRSIWIFDAKSLAILHGPAALPGKFNQITYDPQSHHLAVGAFNGHVQVVHPIGLTPMISDIATGGFVQSLHYGSSSQNLLVATETTHIQLWDTSIPTSPLTSSSGVGSILGEVLIDPSGGHVVTSHDSALLRHNLEQEANASSILLDKPQRSVSALAISPDGTELMAGLSDHRSTQWVCWRLPEFTELSRYSVDFVALNAAFDATGTRILSSDPRGMFRSHEPLTGNVHYEVESASNTTLVHAYSPDRRRAAIILPYNRVGVVDTASGEVLASHPLGATPISRMAFTSSGQHLTFARATGPVVFWSFESVTNQIQENTPPAPVTALLNHGEAVYLGLRSGAVARWLPLSQSWQDFASGHQDAVTALVLSSNQHFVASATGHGEVLVWQTESGLPLIQSVTFDSAVIDLKFVAQDRALVAVTADGTVNRLPIPQISSVPESDALELLESAMGLRSMPDGDMQTVSHEKYIEYYPEAGELDTLRIDRD